MCAYSFTGYSLVYEGYSRQLVNSDGWVFASTMLATLKLSCQLDVTDFPLDKQECTIMMSPFLQQLILACRNTERTSDFAYS